MMLGRLSSLLIEHRNRVFRACDYLFRACVARPPREDGPVLVLRPDGIGDFVIWCDTARCLRDLYAPRKIILAASQVFTNLAESTGYFDQVIPVDTFSLRRRFFYRMKILGRLGQLRPAIILHPVVHRDQFHDTSEAVVRAIPALQVIGWARERRGLRRQVQDDALYTQLVQRTYAGKAVNVHNWTFLQALGAHNGASLLPLLPKLNVTGEATLLPDQPYFVLFPAASSARKCWPAQAFAEIGRRLHDETGWSGWVAGSRNDAVLCDDVCRMAGGCVQSCAGKLSLSQFAELIRRARFLLSNDTGAVHIGGAFQTPTVCILGGGRYGEFLPYKLPDDSDAPNPSCVIHPMPCFGCNWRCLFNDSKERQPVPCIARVDVELVWETVKAKLAVNQELK